MATAKYFMHLSSLDVANLSDIYPTRNEFSGKATRHFTSVARVSCARQLRAARAARCQKASRLLW
jgi:hypothetical protein